MAYQNTGFYNPLTQQHERVTLHFLSSFLPTNGRGGDVATDRVWRVEWDKHFFAMCRATGGTLLFDLDVYRDLSPASRRLLVSAGPFSESHPVFMASTSQQTGALGASTKHYYKAYLF